MTTLFGNDFLARESTGYIHNYPLFSEWMHLLYTWAFPLALLAVTIWGIVVELRLGAVAAETLVPCAIGGAAAVSAVLYIHSLKADERGAVPGTK